MSQFLRRAEEILETAEAGSEEVAIVIDRQGGLRLLPPAGWSLPAMSAEFGAIAVYKVERRGSRIRVEGWDGVRRCLLEKCIATSPVSWGGLQTRPRAEIALTPA